MVNKLISGHLYCVQLEIVADSIMCNFGNLPVSIISQIQACVTLMSLVCTLGLPPWYIHVQIKTIRTMYNYVLLWWVWCVHYHHDIHVGLQLKKWVQRITVYMYYWSVWCVHYYHNIHVQLKKRVHCITVYTYYSDGSGLYTTTIIHMYNWKNEYRDHCRSNLQRDLYSEESTIQVHKTGKKQIETTWLWKQFGAHLDTFPAKMHFCFNPWAAK